MSARKDTRRTIGSINPYGPGRWRVRLDLGYINGKSYRPSKVVEGSKRDAEMELARMMLRAGKGTELLDRITVAEFVETIWLPSKDHLRASTRRGYASAVENHIRPLFATVQLAGLRGFVVEQKLKEIPALGARLNVYKIMSNAMKLAVKSGMVDGDPMFGVTRPRLPEYQAQTYTLDEVVTLLEYVRGDALEVAVLLAVTTGIRRSELAALDWMDLKVDGGRAELEVRRGYHGVRDGETAPKTARSRRTVAIPEFAAARIREIRGERVVRLGPLLADADGNRMSPDGITARWKRLMGRCLSRTDGTPTHNPPVRFVEWKNLRHTHATITLESGVDIVTVSRRLGHASVSTTDSYYLRPGRSADEKAADAFGAAMSVNVRTLRNSQVF